MYTQKNCLEKFYKGLGRCGFCVAVFALNCLVISSTGRAGVMFSSGLHVGSFSFFSEQGEETPNFNGLAPIFIFGYSAHQMFDFGVFTKYTAGNAKEFAITSEDASLFLWGGHFAVSMMESAKVGFKIGQAQYRLVSSEAMEDTVSGFMRGKTYGLTLAALIQRSKSYFFEIGMEYNYAQFIKTDSSGTDKMYKLGQLSLGVVFTFNDFKASFIESRLFKGII